VFCRLTGRAGSELTGPAFSPDGTRLYFSSQRSPGETFEITGPFRTRAPG
jgi:secreted PhoX family phosphatase